MQKVYKRKAVALGMLALVLSAGFVALAFSYANREEPIEKVAVRTGVTSVVVDDFRFSPRAIKVAPGTEVTWTFKDDTKHDVRSASFGSEKLKSGTFSYRFEAPGVYDFRCSIHGNMTGRVVVE